MGAHLSTSAHSRKHLPTFPNTVNTSVTAETSARGVSNPAFNAGIQIDLLLASHADFLRSAVRNKLFGKGDKRCEQSVENYINALKRLDAALLSGFERLCEQDPVMAVGDWKDVDSELVVINEAMRVAFKKAKGNINSRTHDADIEASAAELQRIIGNVERLANPKRKGVGRVHRRK